MPVLQGELGQLSVVVEPLELQRPAALGHAREHQAVPLQMHLRPHRLCLEIGGHIICGKQRHKATSYHSLTFGGLLVQCPNAPGQTEQVQPGHLLKVMWPARGFELGWSDFRA